MSIETEIEISRMVGGDLRQRYEIYLACCDDGNGLDLHTGDTAEERVPLKTFDEWIKS